MCLRPPPRAPCRTTPPPNRVVSMWPGCTAPALWRAWSPTLLFVTALDTTISRSREHFCVWTTPTARVQPQPDALRGRGLLAVGNVVLWSGHRGFESGLRAGNTNAIRAPPWRSRARGAAGTCAAKRHTLFTNTTPPQSNRPREWEGKECGEADGHHGLRRERPREGKGKGRGKVRAGRKRKVKGW